MQTRKGKLKSRFISTGELVSAAMRHQKACSVSSFHCTHTGSPFLVRSERGEAKEEKLGTNHL